MVVFTWPPMFGAFNLWLDCFFFPEKKTHALIFWILIAWGLGPWLGLICFMFLLKSRGFFFFCPDSKFFLVVKNFQISNFCGLFFLVRGLTGFLANSQQPAMKVKMYSETLKTSLPKTNSHFAPENRQTPKRKRYSNHPFSGAKMLVSGRVRDRL